MDTIARMRAFVSVVDAGGFSAAARVNGRSKALMSKYVSELENELGARLLNRTTRQLSLTEAGEAAYDEVRELVRRVGDLRDRIEATTTATRGRLRVSIPTTIGATDVAPAVMAFLAAHPDIRLELSLEDRFVNLVEEGFDVAVRISALADSTLIARKLAKFRVAIFAAPSLIASHGKPKHPSKLAGLPCIIDSNLRSQGNWRFLEDGTRFSVAVKGRVEVNSPQAAAAAARAGLGFCRGPWSGIRRDVEAGQLVTVLEDYELDDLGIYAVYAHREQLPAKIRAFIDHLVAYYEAERKAGRST
jgi:DNA-binding transcriptional LysR family regulator